MKSFLVLLIIFYLSCFNIALATEKIDINSAPLEDLIKIIHIGEARAQELILLRPFSSLDDLARINGIGEQRVKDIKNQGLARVAPTPIKDQPQQAPINKVTENGSPLLNTSKIKDIKDVPEVMIEELVENEPQQRPQQAQINEGLAAVAEPILQTRDEQANKSFSSFLIALIMAIFSGLIILLLKKRSK